MTNVRSVSMVDGHPMKKCIMFSEAFSLT